MKVALFRAAADAAATAERLRARGVDSVLAPVVELGATGATPPVGDFDFVVAASAKAFAFAPPPARPLYVVGEKTAAAARALGLPPVATAADIATLLPTLPQGRALYLAGRDRKPDLEAALGDRVTTFVVYEARARDGWDEAEARAVAAATAALHYSERSADLAAGFAQRAGLAAAFRQMPHVCLSRAVAQRIAAAGAARVLWPRQPAEAELFDTLETALADFGAPLVDGLG